MNNNYYIYKLARQQEKTSYHFFDVDYTQGIDKDAIYYGLTQDPQSRLSKHRPKKGHDGKHWAQEGLRGAPPVGA